MLFVDVRVAEIAPGYLGFGGGIRKVDYNRGFYLLCGGFVQTISSKFGIQGASSDAKFFGRFFLVPQISEQSSLQ